MSSKFNIANIINNQWIHKYKGHRELENQNTKPKENPGVIWHLCVTPSLNARCCGSIKFNSHLSAFITITMCCGFTLGDRMFCAKHFICVVSGLSQFCEAGVLCPFYSGETGLET